MIIIFDNQDIEDLIVRANSQNKLYKKLLKVATFKRDLSIVVGIIRNAPNTAFLSNFGKLNYEKLKHELTGYSSVRIGYKTKYRLIFEEFENGVRVKLIEVNEHYGNK